MANHNLTRAVRLALLAAGATSAGAYVSSAHRAGSSTRAGRRHRFTHCNDGARFALAAPDRGRRGDRHVWCCKPPGPAVAESCVRHPDDQPHEFELLDVERGCRNRRPAQPRHRANAGARQRPPLRRRHPRRVRRRPEHDSAAVHRARRSPDRRRIVGLRLRRRRGRRQHHLQEGFRRRRARRPVRRQRRGRRSRDAGRA